MHTRTAPRLAPVRNAPTLYVYNCQGVCPIGYLRPAGGGQWVAYRMTNVPVGARYTPMTLRQAVRALQAAQPVVAAY